MSSPLLIVDQYRYLSVTSSDLDGDTYLVIWDSELVPPNVPPYEQRTASSSGSPSGSQEPGQRTPEDFKRAAVETFLDHHHNLLLRSMANEWKRRATHSPDLANDEIARKLQPLVESALVRFFVCLLVRLLMCCP